MVYKFILFSIIGITITDKAIGTECLQCVDGSISPQNIADLIPDYVKKLSSPECPRATSATKGSKVIFGPCPNNQTDRCGTLRGSVKLSLKSFGSEATVTFFLRDCFAVNNNTASGCYTDQNILNDQKANLEKKFGNDLKTFGVEVEDIQNGEFCINKDGTNKSCTLMYSSMWLLIMLMLVPLIV
ncbi:uncharacterized protein LOC134696508 [Mytilus trossulus]|uniref:uncharacterized protein LOC134696508 n=1 Tax=Mytilus trossulus TaxID=6551 RepID=UPI003004D237